MYLPFCFSLCSWKTSQMYTVLFFSLSLVGQPFPWLGTSFILFLNCCKAKSHKFFPFLKRLPCFLLLFNAFSTRVLVFFFLILHTDLPRLEVFSLLLNKLSIAPKCPSSISREFSLSILRLGTVYKNSYVVFSLDAP